MSLCIDDAAVVLFNVYAYLVFAVFLIFGLGRAYCYDKQMRTAGKTPECPGPTISIQI